MQPGAILDSARNMERFDYQVGRNYGFDHQPPASGGIHIGLLTGQVAIHYEEQFDQRRTG